MLPIGLCILSSLRHDKLYEIFQHLVLLFLIGRICVCLNCIVMTKLRHDGIVMISMCNYQCDGIVMVSMCSYQCDGFVMV